MPWISKEIRIEMGHRLQHHKGKCFNLHGHSYKIEFAVKGPIQNNGPSICMVEDYDVLKGVLKEIDAVFDHKMVLAYDDPLLPSLLSSAYQSKHVFEFFHDTQDIYMLATSESGQRFVLLASSPTAEILASIWLTLCVASFKKLMMGFSQIQEYRMRVWETETSCCEVTYGV